MNIVILGAGHIGSYLAEVLSLAQYNVILLDKDPEKLAKISKESDIATICADGAKWEVLDELLEHDPSLFIALSGSDEINLVTCSMAKNLGYPITVARVKNPGYLGRSRLDFGRLFYVDHFIGAEILASHDLLKNIINPQDLAIENFAHGSIQMRTIVIPPEWKKSHLAIKDLNLPEELIISVIRKKGKEQTPDNEEIIFPHGNDHIDVGDEITVIGQTNTMYQLHEFFSSKENIVSSVVIVGGSNISYNLARILEKLNISVKIIERDEKRCEELADILPKATIIHHDGTDINFLLSEQVQNAGAFIACRTDDETNLLLAMLGKKAGCKKVVALISDIKLAPLLRDMDIHFSVSERVNIANRIFSLLNEEKLISISSLYDNQANVVEMKVSKNSDLVGIPLADLSHRLPKDLLIAAIENKGQVMIGKGSRILSPNDTVIIISSPQHISELQELF